MFIATNFTGLDTFTKDLEYLKTDDEQHVNASQVADELWEELERLGSNGEETHIYRTSNYEFHFIIAQQGEFTCSIHYTGYTKGF